MMHAMLRTALAAALALAILAAPAAAQSVVTPAPDPGHAILSPAFQGATDTRSHSRLTDGNRLALLENGVVSFPVKHALIATATAQVMVMTMHWPNDATGDAMADALAARAAAGVTVRAVVDGTLVDVRILRKLRAGGVRVARYNAWNWFGGRSGRLHEKVVCADLARAVVGGMNIGDAYALGNGTNGYFHDADVLVEGYAAGEVARRFLEIYTQLEPGDTQARDLLAKVDTFTQQPAALSGTTGTARVIVNEPDLARHYITDYYARCMGAARRQVIWHVNNTVPVDPLLTEFKAAGARGARAILVTNSKKAFQEKWGRFAGWWMYLWTDAFYRRRLRGPGVEIWEMDNPIHSKVFTVDGVLASIGSYNFGASSIEHNTESVVASHDPALIRAVEEMFDRDLARARRAQ